MMDFLVALMTNHQCFSALCNHHYLPRLFALEILYLIYMMYLVFSVLSLITTEFTPAGFEPAVDGGSALGNNGNNGWNGILASFTIHFVEFRQLADFPARLGFIGNAPALRTNAIFFTEILYLIFDYPHKHHTFKHFEV